MLTLVRKNIQSLAPYSCARDEFKGEARIYLDANENPYNGPLNRYPDPLQTRVKEKIAALKGVRPTQIMLGNGSDEPIDLVYRVFCEPRQDNVVAIEPTYGMYRVCADINDVEYRPVRLDADFGMSAQALIDAADANTKVAWVCSPNNPSGNLMKREQLETLLDRFPGIVVIDEAYIDFAGSQSWLATLDRFPRLIVLQTFSKAWGLAGVRCGMAFASEQIIALFNKVKYPYNVNILTQQTLLERLDNPDQTRQWVKTLLEQREVLTQELNKLPHVVRTHPSDANFVLTQFKDANATYAYLVGKGIVTRNRNRVTLCEGCVRITVGTPEENAELLAELRNM